MKKIAIIGAGIGGLSTAYHLNRDYAVTIFDKENYFGGHTDTHSLQIEGQSVRIDSGFIIFCPEFYPHFSAMLDNLGVASKPTDMSFSAHNQTTGLVYNATSLNKLFCQRRNLINPRFYRMLFDLIRFYSRAEKVLKTDDVSLTVKQFLEQNHYGEGFAQDHLYPMISALWSATPERVEQFPIRHLVEFFRDHGLLKLVSRPQWKVLENGSASYVEALQAHLKCDWRRNTKVTAVKRNQDGVTITSESYEDIPNNEDFDAVVFATHSDQALTMIQQPSKTETEVLSAIQFERNHVVVHTDEDIMHPNQQSWASWNTEVPAADNAQAQTCCTANYWMNSLQGLSLKTNVFTTLNSNHRINPSKILAERHYAHPIFTATSVAAQRKKALIDGKNRSYFVGAYWGWGFHEDGARSGYHVSQLIREQI